MAGAVFAIALALVGVIDTPLIAVTQGTFIQVGTQSAESHFPDDLTFSLLVRSDAGDIMAANLYLQVGWEETMRLVAPEPFTPAPEVELTAVWNTFAETIPPFVEITYYWEVIDSTGETLNTEPVRIEYADATHDWQRLEDDHIVIFWYDQPASFGEALFQASRGAYDHVAHIIGITTQRAIRVVIYNDQEDFCAFYAPRTCQDWIGGQTFSGITVQWGSNLNWFTDDVVPHELAHVFYGEIFRDTWLPVPTWFNEGIAVYNERQDHSWDMTLVRDAAGEGKLATLPVMTRGRGVAHGEVDLWYAVAYSLVAYLAETYGEETLGELILTVADSIPFEDALVQTMGLDMVQLEMEWRAWLGYPADSIPTPVPFPTMPEVTIVPPAVPRGQPTRTPTPTDNPTTTLTYTPASTDTLTATLTYTPPTATPHPPVSSIPTPTVPHQETPPDRPCLGFLVIPLGGAIGWRFARRRLEEFR
jgi:hypothetical protein